MSALFLLIEALLWLVDLITVSGDVYAWFKGKRNRIARKESRKAGETPPPRDRWNRRVILLTITAGILTAGLLWWRFAAD